MYYLYLLRTDSGALYTGITTDPARRLSEHRGERAGGARYTRSHGAAEMAAVWEIGSRSAASRLEYRVKRLSHAEKERLIAENAAGDIDLRGAPERLPLFL